MNKGKIVETIGDRAAIKTLRRSNRRATCGSGFQFVLIFLTVASAGLNVGSAEQESNGVTFESDTLLYHHDEQRNRIIDFSHCGYSGGERPIPDVTAIVRVAGADGDDTDRIQAAVDYVSSLGLQGNGTRGAVLLAAGEFQVSSSIRISATGVVLRGSGADTTGTTIRATGKHRRELIRIASPPSQSRYGPMRSITDEYVPVGASRLRVNDTSGLAVGESVVVTRPSTAAWINAIGCDVEDIGWRAGSVDIRWRRIIKAIDDDTIQLDCPLTTAIEQRFGGGTVQKVDESSRIEHVGIEDLRLVSDFDTRNPLDEEHSWFGVTMQNVANAWVRRTGFRHFAGGAVLLGDRASRVTVQDCVSWQPISEVGGYRRHSFCTQGQQCLFLRCWAEHGRHDFSAGLGAPGPNAFVNCYASEAILDSGPMGSWTTGVLYDNVRIDGADLQLANRRSSPPKTGWTAANCVLWQCQAANVRCEKPPTANNWAIGVWAATSGDGVIQHRSEFVKPTSLYQQQVRERLGNEAANRVGTFLLKPTGATNPSVEQAAKFASQSNLPARQLIDLIHDEWQRYNRESPDDLRSIDIASPKVEGASDNIVPTTATLSIRNGWLVMNGKLRTGKHYTPQWWRGSLRPDKAEEFGPAITRFVPGRLGTGLTDELDEVVNHLTRDHYVGYDHHYGLWYDRRRDDHLMVRRADGNVVPPFYEQPFARSGEGKAWDGLSRYDLGKFNTWYWSRLRSFATLCDRGGLVLFHHNYLQHNVLEAGAHWADSPWRPANNVNQTGFPEPPPYVGDKRIFLAHQFYDISDDRRRELHRNYIRQCLSNFEGQRNVIQLISGEFTGPLSFMQFWLDTIIEWEQETNSQVFIGLSCTKDVQDAILSDPVRNPHVDIIDIRYWTYTDDGELYAPKGGQNLSPRQHLRQQRPSTASFGAIVRSVREYRLKYPNKAVTFYADLYCRSRRDGWAVLIGGGSLPNLPELPAELAAAIVSMQPTDQVKLSESQWSWGRDENEFLIYSRGRNRQFTIPHDDTSFQLTDLDTETGKAISKKEVTSGEIIQFPADAVIWLRATSNLAVSDHPDASD